MAENENLNHETETVATDHTEEKPYISFSKEEYDNLCGKLKHQGRAEALKGAKIEDENGSTFNAKEFEAKYRKDLEAKIIADYEKKQKMTESEKLSAEREEFNNYKIQTMTELNKSKARVLLSKAGYEDDEMELFLDFVNEDEDLSLGKITRICEYHTKHDDKLKNQFQAELQKSNPNVKIDGNDVNSLQTQYDNALKSGDLATANTCIRIAQSKGITIKQY